MIKVFNSPFRITQKFGERPDYYKQFGLVGHEGLDLVPTSSDWSIYSLPHKGIVVKDIDMGSKGGAYGVHVTVWYPDINEAWMYCHLKTNTVSEGQTIDPAVYLGQMGDSGNTQGAHLHLNRFKVDSRGYRQNKSNGYLGGIDPLPFLEESVPNVIPVDQNKLIFELRAVIQQKDDRIGQLDGIVSTLQKNLETSNKKYEEARKDLQICLTTPEKASKTPDDFSVSELLGALVRKLKG